MKATREAITAAVAALEASRDRYAHGDAEALSSIRRIVGRIRDAALNSNLAAIAHIASALLESERPDEIAWLAEHLAVELQAGPGGVPDDPAVILLIEDDRVTAQVMADALRNSSRTILQAHSAADGEKILREHNVSLLLLDLVLPDADGRDVLARLRERSETRGLPIIVITARLDPGTQSECFALGADGVLTKPVRPDVLASAVAARLQQARDRQRESRVDHLTGLPNRAAFGEALDRALPLAHQSGRPLAVAMIDLDHFKSINDEHSHATGDLVLQRAGQRISGALRISDFVARWGGEEFSAFLPNTTLEGAVIALEKALREVRGLHFSGANGNSFAITFSAGVALLTRDLTPADALAEADRLLYLAKAAGRNRVLSTRQAEQPVRPIALLVEDDDAVAGFLIPVLQRDGYEVVRFADGESAYAAALERPFALAILDVGLPRMDGFELLRLLRETRELKSMPIVMLTGSSEESEVVRGFELGVNDYIPKPFRASELLARLRRLRNRR